MASGRRGIPLALALACVFSGAAAAERPVTETIVLIRHGEKPALGLGQLNCQGLNRALALPVVIGREFGRPDAIFAPDPARSADHDHPDDYVRPLATIEPTAIAFGRAVDASIAVTDLETLRRRLGSPTYRSALVVVAWEHGEIVKLARLLLAADQGIDPDRVPDWQESDFDSMYVVKLTWAGENAAVTFEQRREGLDGQSIACPGQAPG